MQHVPIDAIAAQRQTDDPLKQSFGALMTAYAKGDVIDGAAAVAEQHGVDLRSVEDTPGKWRPALPARCTREERRTIAA